MKIYLAALLYNDFRVDSSSWRHLNERERRAVVEVKHILDSYHYIGNERMVKRIRETGRKIFLDSGAFSSFTQGTKVNLERYCAYVLKNQDLFEVVSVLDAIGDPDQTYRNQVRMERLGVTPLPCYHYGEPEAILEYYVSNYEYITIGGMVPISSAQLKIWLDRIWGRHLTNEDGSPKVKVHGFGLTSVPLMARYPWYSVDSSSWVQLGGIGTIFTPQFGPISVSDRAPQLKEAGHHIDNLAPEEREVMYAWVEELGFDMDRLRKMHLARKCLNMVTYGSMMAEQLENKTFVQPQPVLF